MIWTVSAPPWHLDLREDQLQGVHAITAEGLPVTGEHLADVALHCTQCTALRCTALHCLSGDRGLTAGTLGCCVNIPFDVAKNRIQVEPVQCSAVQGPQPVPGEVKYRGTARVIGMVYREEGSRLPPLRLMAGCSETHYKHQTDHSLLGTAGSRLVMSI